MRTRRHLVLASGGWRFAEGGGFARRNLVSILFTSPLLLSRSETPTQSGSNFLLSSQKADHHTAARMPTINEAANILLQNDPPTFRAATEVEACPRRAPRDSPLNTWGRPPKLTHDLHSRYTDSLHDREERDERAR